MRRKQILALLLAVGVCFSQIVPVYADSANSLEADSEVKEQTVDSLTNLIPEIPNTETPNYVCTWSYQDWAAYSDDYTPVRDGSPRSMLNHEQLFGENGWVNNVYPKEMRGDLIYLLDDGWDLPYNDSGDYFGSHIVDPQKFPGYGETPKERLKTLVANIENAGWKGAGIWICANEMKSEQGKGWNEAYWRERIEWSKYAGMDYWKIDWGNHSGDKGWRKLISDLKDEIYPELVIEHITGLGTLNGSGTDTDARLSAGTVNNNAWCLSYSDVYRTYDVNGNLSIPTTFERIGRQLEAAYTNGSQLGLINGEDEVYMDSVLGLTCGVMRYPIGDALSGSLPNIFFGGAEDFTESRPIRKMHDEVRRAVMWQRIAPAYRADAYQTVLSGELSDNWYYENDDTWDTGRAKGYRVQKAPAVIARGMEVPVVNAVNDQAVPFVAASRNPNGAISIGTYGRTTQEKGYQKALADITLPVGALTGKIGVFGYYNSLTMTFDESVAGKTIYAQDLMNMEGDTAQDITDKVTVSQDGKSVTFSGELLEQIGLSQAADGDFSEPGLVIQIGKEEDFKEAPATRHIPVSEIPNSSFELTTYGDEKKDALVWEEKIIAGNDNNFYVEKGTEANPAHTGEYYAVQSGDNDYEGSLTFKMPYMKNGVYDVSVWVKANEHKIPSTITVKENGGPVRTEEIPVTDEWKKVILKNVFVKNQTCRFEVYSKASAGEYVYIDDITAERSTDVNALMEMVKEELISVVWSNDDTENAVKQRVQKMLDADVKATIANYEKMDATNDDAGKIVFKVILENAYGKAEESFEFMIPKSSMLSNAGFEFGNGEVSSDWQLWSRTGGNFYREAKDQDPFAPHGGEWYGAKWGNNYDCSIYQIVNNLPNGPYKATAWVRNTPFTGTASPSAAAFLVKDYGGSMRYVDVSSGNADWTEVSIDNINVTNGKVHVEVYAFARGETQWILLDDFNLMRQDYAVTVTDTKNGTITVDKGESVEWGKEVTVAATSDNQYRVKEDSLKVYKTDDPDTVVEMNGDTFVMPQYPVTITAEFEAATPEKPEETDKEYLAELIKYAEKQQENENYLYVVPAVKNAFEKALADADTVNKKAGATQAEVDEAYDKLLKLVHMLDFTGNNAKLSELVQQVQNLKEELYTAATWSVFETARTKAESVLADENSLQAEIDAARVALRNAIFQLRLIPDKGQLEGLIKSAQAVNTANYTVKSATAFAKALDNAKAVFADENATEEEVKAAEKALEEAQKNLVAKEDADKEADSKDGNKVASDNGSKKEVSKSAAKTGDAGTVLWAAVAGAAALAALVALKKKR